MLVKRKFPLQETILAQTKKFDTSMQVVALCMWIFFHIYTNFSIIAANYSQDNELKTSVEDSKNSNLQELNYVIWLQFVLIAFSIMILILLKIKRLKYNLFLKLSMGTNFLNYIANFDIAFQAGRVNSIQVFSITSTVSLLVLISLFHLRNMLLSFLVMTIFLFSQFLNLKFREGSQILTPISFLWVMNGFLLAGFAYTMQSFMDSIAKLVIQIDSDEIIKEILNFIPIPLFMLGKNEKDGQQLVISVLDEKNDQNTEKVLLEGGGSLTDLYTNEAFRSKFGDQISTNFLLNLQKMKYYTEGRNYFKLEKNGIHQTELYKSNEITKTAQFNQILKRDSIKQPSTVNQLKDQVKDQVKATPTNTSKISKMDHIEQSIPGIRSDQQIPTFTLKPQECDSLMNIVNREQEWEGIQMNGSQNEEIFLKITTKIKVKEKSKYLKRLVENSSDASSSSIPYDSTSLDSINIWEYKLLEVVSYANSQKSGYFNNSCLLGCMTDLSDQYQKERLEEEGKSRDTMMAGVTHDLQTPLNCMIALLQTAEQYEQKVEVRKMVEIIKLNAFLLLHLVDDILDNAKIMNQKLQLIPMKLTITHIVMEVIDLMRVQARQKRISIVPVFHVPKDFTAFTDGYRLKQILLNLVSNSLKFTPQNGLITIQIDFLIIEQLNDFTNQSIQALIQPFMASFEERRSPQQSITLAPLSVGADQQSFFPIEHQFTLEQKYEAEKEEQKATFNLSNEDREQIVSFSSVREKDGRSSVVISESEKRKSELDLSSQVHHLSNNRSELIKVSVQDTGQGMSEKIKKALFQPFSTFNDKQGNNNHGTGLGLMVSQKLVGFLGPIQKIYVESSQGQGSNFSFLLHRNINSAIVNSAGLNGSKKNSARSNIVEAPTHLSQRNSRPNHSRDSKGFRVQFTKTHDLDGIGCDESGGVGSFHSHHMSMMNPGSNILIPENDHHSIIGPGNVIPPVVTGNSAAFSEHYDHKDRLSQFSRTQMLNESQSGSKEQKQQDSKLRKESDLSEDVPLESSVKLSNIDIVQRETSFKNMMGKKDRRKFFESGKHSESKEILKNGQLMPKQSTIQSLIENDDFEEIQNMQDDKKYGEGGEEGDDFEFDRENQQICGYTKILNDIFPANPNILIIDDTPFSALGLGMMLDSIKNAHIQYCYSGEEAIELIQDNTFDVELIFLDICMPEMDGIETIKRIKQLNLERLKKVKFFAVTGFTSEEDQLQFSNAGFDGFLPQPITFDNLISVITVNKDKIGSHNSFNFEI